MIIDDCLLEKINAVLRKCDGNIVGRKKNVRKDKIQSFVLYLLLVYSKYRSCYLIDCLPCYSIATAVDIVADISDYFNLRREIFTIFLLGDDVAIANNDELREKIYSKDNRTTVLLEVSPRQAKVALESTLNIAVQSFLSSMEKGLLRVTQGFDVYRIPHGADLPFAAGWLLGYACVYTSARSSDHDDGSINLGEAVIQFSVMAELGCAVMEHTQGIPTAKDKTRKVDTVLVDLMEFTIPQAPLLLSGDEGGASLEDFVQAQVEDFVAELRSRILATGGGLGSALQLRTVSFSKSVHAVAQKMFL